MSALKMPGPTSPGAELLAGALGQLDAAAKALGLSRSALYRRLERYGP